MDPVKQIKSLLDEHGAELIRTGKHQVWEFPKGGKFTLSNTPSDYRSKNNELSNLRKFLRENGYIKYGSLEARPHVEEAAAEPPAPAAIQMEPIPSEPDPAKDLNSRIEDMIKQEEKLHEDAFTAAQLHEANVNLLKSLLSHQQSASVEDVLQRLFPPKVVLQEVRSQPPKPEPPPQVVVERVQVTRNLVYAAASTFGEFEFTVNDVRDVMTRSMVGDQKELFRIRSSIASCIVAMVEAGKIIRTAEGMGRREAKFRLAEPSSAESSKG